MPLFKKEKNLIPPVEPSVSSRPPSTLSAAPSYRTTASTYVPSRDGDPYATSRYNSATSGVPDQSDEVSFTDKYRRNKGVGDVYSRGTANQEQERNELFSGYNPQKSGSGRFFDGPGVGGDPANGEENDEDVEGIKQQTRYVKQESVNSTRNALMMARQAEETARGTLNKLGDQSGK